MGIFANAPEEGSPGWIEPKPPRRAWNGESEWDAMGVEVPFFRQQNGYDACKDMGMTDKAKIMDLVGGMCERIARDEPHAAMEFAAKYLDVTGVYRLLATLLTGDKPDV